MTEKIDVQINIVNTKSVQQTNKGLDTLGKTAERSGKRVETAFKSSTDALSVFQGALGAGATIGIFRGITSSIGSLGSAVVNEGKKIETFTTQFTTLTGSVQGAEDQIKQLQDFAASTPFQLEGIADSAKVLLSFGFEASQTTNLLQKIGDVAAISGKPLKDLAVIFGQVSAAGKLTGERFNQLVESGVNVGPEIAKILNISEKAVRNAITTGQVTSDVFQQAFSNLSAEGGLAFNGMISLSQTLGGVLSTLGDNFSLIAADIGKELLPIIKSVAISTIELAQNFREFFTNNIEEIKIFTGVVAGLSVGFGVLAVKLGLASIGVTSLSSAFGLMGAAAKAAWILATGPIGLVIAGLSLVGGAIVAITNNYKGFGETAKRAAASVVDFVSIGLDVLASFESGVRKVLGSIVSAYNVFVDFYLSGIQKLAEVTDKVLGTDTASSIGKFRDSIGSAIDTFKNGDSVISELSAKTRIYSETLRESARTQEEARLADERRIETLSKLRTEQEKLQEILLTGNAQERAAAKIRLAELDAEIGKIEGRIEVEKKKKEAVITSQQQLLDINRKFNETSLQLEKEASGKSLVELKALLESRRLEQIKSLRDQAVKDGDFQAASLAQQQLNEAEKTASLIETQKKRQEEIDKLAAEQAEIDNDKKQIQAELKLVEDEADKEALTLKLEELEIVRLEAEAKELEARGKHLEAIQKQREIDAIKAKQSLKIKSDDEIREARATARVKEIIAKTSGEQLIGIGENLTKAGILQGKTGAKALQGIKIAEATISTFAGASKALELGFPAGLIAATSIVASGLANVATIRSQKFATGGIVQPIAGSRGVDTVPALLSAGEEVLTTGNPRHRDNISRQENEDIIEELRGLRQDIQQMQTIVNIDGKEVADVIQEQRFRGVR